MKVSPILRAVVGLTQRKLAFAALFHMQLQAEALLGGRSTGESSESGSEKIAFLWRNLSVDVCNFGFSGLSGWRISIIITGCCSVACVGS